MIVSLGRKEKKRREKREREERREKREERRQKRRSYHPLTEIFNNAFQIPRSARDDSFTGKENRKREERRRKRKNLWAFFSFFERLNAIPSRHFVNLRHSVKMSLNGYSII
jgi:hypothetical protein